MLKLIQSHPRRKAGLSLADVHESFATVAAEKLVEETKIAVNYLEPHFRASHSVTTCSAKNMSCAMKGQPQEIL